MSRATKSFTLHQGQRAATTIQRERDFHPAKEPKYNNEANPDDVIKPVEEGGEWVWVDKKTRAYRKNTR